MKESVSPLRLICSILISVLVAISVGFVLLLVFSALSLSAKDPLSYVMPLSLFTLGFASVICGLLVSLLNRRSDLPTYLLGTLAGAVLVLLLFVISLVPINGNFFFADGVRAAVYIGVVLLSLLGSVIAKPRRKKHAKYTPKRRRR